MELALATNNLTKTFGRGQKPVHALQGVTLAVQPGEIFSLLGPNGAGKTTLIKCVLGIVFATSGSGTVLGYPLASVKAKEHIGYLPENHRYPLHLSGEQVLDYFGKLSGLTGTILTERIDRSLHTVGMTDWRTTKVRKYSKGMMQRLGLAQALMNDPQLIILDEPTDGVDPVGRKEIRDVLEFLRDQGKTIFLNSHLLSEVERISDKVVIMDHGKIIREGTVEQLTRSGNLYQLKVENYTPAIASGLLSNVVTDQGGMLEINCQTLEDLNHVIDALRGHGVLIESVIPKKSTLEDLFIDLIKTSDLTKQ